MVLAPVTAPFSVIIQVEVIEVVSALALALVPAIVVIVVIVIVVKNNRIYYLPSFQMYLSFLKSPDQLDR
jgi:hypothetical protein